MCMVCSLWCFNSTEIPRNIIREESKKKTNPKNMSISCQKHTHIRKPTFGTRIRTQTQCRMSHFCTHRITDYSVICCSAQRGNMKLCELYLTPTAQCTSATVMLTFHSPQKQLQEVLVTVGIAEYDYLYSCCWLPTYLSFSLYV